MEDEKQLDTNQNVGLKVEKVFNEADIASLDAESSLLLNHKSKFVVGKDGNGVTFYPSPHLYDKNGNFDIKNVKSLNADNMDSVCSAVAGKLGCDAVESAFNDRNDNFKNICVSRSRSNSFINAAEMAWAQHFPLKLEPTQIWLLVLQAVALHVDKNAEALRKKWVMHDGKKDLIVRRDDLVKGARERNRWNEVIESFCDQIDQNTVENTVPLLESDFSNATATDEVATKVTIMDICKNYFTYRVMTKCGFPSVTLAGTKEDWLKIYKKAETLLATKVAPDFGKKWGAALLPVLARFVSAFDGEIDCLFWNSMIKRGARHGSGGWSWYSGWINIFFPLIQGHDNTFCEPYSGSRDYIQSGLERAGRGNDINNYPNGLASAPVIWEYYNVEFKLKFIAGFVGITQDKETRALSPLVGWVIGEQTKKNTDAVAAITDKMKQAASANQSTTK